MAKTDSQLSGRARRVLQMLLGPQADLDRPEIVAQASEQNLKRTLGCGKATLQEIRQWLSARGITLEVE